MVFQLKKERIIKKELIRQFSTVTYQGTLTAYRREEETTVIHFIELNGK
jgi:hypothetical protein